MPRDKINLIHEQLASQRERREMLQAGIDDKAPAIDQVRSTIRGLPPGPTRTTAEITLQQIEFNSQISRHMLSVEESLGSLGEAVLTLFEQVQEIRDRLD